jgi:chemotaxis protein MotB
MSQSKFSKPEAEAPIRIVKKKAGHGGHHGGAWKVAYADFVTAMMALFIVLWIVGQSKQVKQYVANYFKDPGAFFTNTKGGGPFEANKIGLGGQAVDEELLRRTEQKQQQAFQSMGKQIVGNLASSRDLKHLIGQIEMKIVKEGLRIELLEKSESFFFDVGTATLKPEAQEVLAVIAKEVGRLPNHVIIEGHTDSRPYSRADGYSNFELSAERANSARRTLVTRGVEQSKIDEVRGYADTQLRNTQDPLDVTNRRISILVKFMGE